MAAETVPVSLTGRLHHVLVAWLLLLLVVVVVHWCELWSDTGSLARRRSIVFVLTRAASVSTQTHRHTCRHSDLAFSAHSQHIHRHSVTSERIGETGAF